MKRTISLAAVLALGLVACMDFGAPSGSSLSSAFSSLPLGFQFVPSTFAGGSAADSNGWAPGDGQGFGRFGEGEGHGGPGMPGRGGPGDGSMMCGGMGGAFHGDGKGFGFGPGFDRGLFGGIFAGTSLPGTCAYDAGSGRVVCDPATHNGLTIVRSAAYTDAGGNAQTAFDSLTTNAINIRVRGERHAGTPG